jgi:hypothetical protein
MQTESSLHRPSLWILSCNGENRNSIGYEIDREWFIDDVFGRVNRPFRYGFGRTQEGQLLLLDLFMDLSSFIRKGLFLIISNQKKTLLTINHFLFCLIEYHAVFPLQQQRRTEI